MSRSPIDALLDEAELALAEGDPETALRICEGAVARAPAHAGVLFVRGEALRALGDLLAAADSFQAAALAEPASSISWSALAVARFELLELDQAERAIVRALREDPSNPEAWWARSLVQDWRKDTAGAYRARLHARWLSPRDYPLPPSLSDEEIEAIVQSCVDALHPRLQEFLLQVAILLDDMPDESLLGEYDPPASPLDLLGHFSGHSIQARSLEDPWSHLPPTIVLFRKNLQRYAADRAGLEEQLRITVFHEIGHFLGLDEAEVAARGLE